MKRSRFAEEQILYALRQVESGAPVADVCRQLGCSEASFYLWKKRHGNLGLTEIKELRQLRDENARLKRALPCSAASTTGRSPQGRMYGCNLPWSQVARYAWQ